MENKEDLSLLLQEKRVSLGEETQEKEPASNGTLDVNEPQSVIRFDHAEPIEERDTLVNTTAGRISSPRQPWLTSFFECFGSDDEFCMQDLKICLLGTFVPCVLYGSNMMRIKPGKTNFFFDCCVYTSLCLGSAAVCQLLNLNLSCNAASLYTFPGRAALRKAHNLTGCGGFIVDECRCCLTRSENEEGCDSFGDFALHCCCHRCALCQEGREILRRTAKSNQTFFYQTSVPSKQTMESRME